MCEYNWTEAEDERQDCVDNAIYNLLLDLSGADEDKLEWNIEEIGEIRDAVQEIIVEKHKLLNEQEFYPYREWDKNGNIILEPSKEPDNKPDEEPELAEEMIVTDDELVTAMKKEVEDIDAEQLAQWAGDALGGLCWYLNDGTYSFIPDENYYGALDFTKEERHD